MTDLLESGTPLYADETPLLTPRTTCLYCEQRGKKVQLVPCGHWGICPECDPVRAAAADPDPLLLRKGVPGWAGRG